MTDNSDAEVCLLCVGIVIAIVWIIYNPLSFFATLIIGIGAYLFYTYHKKQELERKKIEFNERVKEKRKKLIDKGLYKYIENFVIKYGDSSIEIEYYEHNLDKLRNLLSQKGIELDYDEIHRIVEEEINRQEYQKFKNKILANNPKDTNEYIKYFLEIYGEDYEYYLDFLTQLLQERGIELDKQSIREKVEKIKNDLELQRFEKRLLSQSYYQLSISDIDSMTGYEFEKFLKILFEKMGYKVEHTKISRDQGADLILNKFGEKIVVQAKRYDFSRKVGNKAIQEIVAAIKYYNADKGIVITTSEFTTSAIDLARANKIELIDRYKLKKLVSEYL